jgi:hypothetical protein
MKKPESYQPRLSVVLHKKRHAESQGEISPTSNVRPFIISLIDISHLKGFASPGPICADVKCLPEDLDITRSLLRYIFVLALYAIDWQKVKEPKW